MIHEQPYEIIFVIMLMNFYIKNPISNGATTVHNVFNQTIVFHLSHSGGVKWITSGYL